MFDIVYIAEHDFRVIQFQIKSFSPKSKRIRLFSNFYAGLHRQNLVSLYHKNIKGTTSYIYGHMQSKKILLSFEILCDSKILY